MSVGCHQKSNHRRRCYCHLHRLHPPLRKRTNKHMQLPVWRHWNKQFVTCFSVLMTRSIYVLKTETKERNVKTHTFYVFCNKYNEYFITCNIEDQCPNSHWEIFYIVYFSVVGLYFFLIVIYISKRVGNMCTYVSYTLWWYIILLSPESERILIYALPESNIKFGGNSFSSAFNTYYFSMWCMIIAKFRVNIDENDGYTQKTIMLWNQ